MHIVGKLINFSKALIFRYGKRSEVLNAVDRYLIVLFSFTSVSFSPIYPNDKTSLFTINKYTSKDDFFFA